MLQSVVCRSEHFEEPWYARWRSVTGFTTKTRKMWEWHAIAQALSERGKLRPGMSGIGFAVGREPLTSLFAAQGVVVLASDAGGDGEAAQHWRATRADTPEAIFKPELVDRSEFDQLVTFRPIDMTDLSKLEPGAYDFCWSSCAMEHLGSLEAGLEFVLDSTRLLRTGGVGVHTTEFNLTSNDDTWDSGNVVIYRERDLMALGRSLRHMDAALVRMDLDGGTHEDDIKADYPPYFKNGRVHLKLRLGPYVSTSVLLIVQN